MMLLSPVALLYGCIIYVRNKLFDWQIFKSQAFDVPIICIGNLEIGGSGKTPMSDFLIKHLSQKYKIGYLSRGYKRKTNGYVQASTEETVDSLGDEAFQIYQKWKDTICLAVDADRRRGITQLVAQNPGTEIILLDDAMQHRWVLPRVLIQLTPFARPFYQNHILPWGTLRDQKKEYRRANLLVFTKAPFASENLLNNHIKSLKSSGFEVKPSFVSVLHYLNPVNSKGETLEAGASVVAVAGLANNFPFFEEAKSRFSVSRTISKPDHYRYLPTFFQTNWLNNQRVLTTEKDFYKLIAIAPQPDLVYYLPIEMQFLYPELFLQTIENQL